MKKLKELRARLKAIVEANDAIIAKEQITADDLKALADGTAEAIDIEAQIETLEKAASVKARSAKAAGASTEDDDEATGGVAAQPRVKLSSIEKLGIIIQAKIASKESKGALTEQAALEAYGYGQFLKEFADTAGPRGMKTLNTQTAVSGGLLVPDNVSNDIIELLRPMTAFLRIPGMRRIPMPNGTYQQPGAATGGSAFYTTEGEPAKPTEQTFRDIQMIAKTLTCLVPFTNDLLNWSIPGLRQFVQDDMFGAMSEKMDAMMFRGDGMAGNPRGLYNIQGIIATTPSYATSTTPTAAQIDQEARRLLNYFILRNNTLTNVAWVMHATTIGYLQDLKNSDGSYVYPTMQGDAPRFRNIPVIDTTNLPANLGVGSNETQIALIKGSDVLFGETAGLNIATSDEAMIEMNGQALSMFQRRMTAIMGWMQHDVNVRHLESVVVMSAVKWGA